MSARAAALRGNLENSVIDCGAYSVMVGMGEVYIAAFALALGLGEVMAGLMASVPMLVGSVLQLVSPRGVAWMGSHRRWVVSTAALQALSFVPLVVGALHGSLPSAVFFAAVALYWGAGQATGPAWNTWMEHLVPRRIRARYFAQRNRVAHAAVLTGLVTAGLILAAADARGRPVLGFAVIFAVAATARMTSARFLARQTAEPARARAYPRLSLLKVMGRFSRGEHGHLVLYLLVAQLTVQTAAPYFHPFMLGELQLPYDRFMILVATSLLARIASMPLFGALAHRLGARRVMSIGGLGIVPLAGIWAISNNFYYLLLAQVLSGVAWAAHELGSQLLTMELVKKEERTSILTFFNLMNAVCIATGATLGGLVLQTLGQDRAAYHAVFLGSSVVRLLSLVFLWRLGRRLPVVQPAGSRVATLEGNDARTGRFSA